MRLPTNRKSKKLKHETNKESKIKKPKRPLSAFMFFVRLNRANVTKNLINRNAKEVAAKLGDIWKNINSGVKQKFEQLALVDKNRYIEAKKIYMLSNNTVIHIVKPRNSYVIFSIEQRLIISQQQPHLKFLEVNQIIVRHWKALKDKEKQLYKDKAEADKIRYIKEVNII